MGNIYYKKAIELGSNVSSKEDEISYLRELQTLMGHQDRLYEWADITKEAVSR